MSGNFPRKTQPSERNGPPDLGGGASKLPHSAYLGFFMQVIWDQVGHVTFPIKSLWRKCRIENTDIVHFATAMMYFEFRHISSCCDTLLSWFHILFGHIWLLCDVTNGVTELGHRRFSSVTCEQIEIESIKKSLWLQWAPQIDWYVAWPP